MNSYFILELISSPLNFISPQKQGYRTRTLILFGIVIKMSLPHAGSVLFLIN